MRRVALSTIALDQSIPVTSKPAWASGTRSVRPAAEVQEACTRQHRPLEHGAHPQAHRPQNRIAFVRPIVGRRHTVEGANGVGERLFGRYDAHGACLQPVLSEQTHRRQIGFALTSNTSRNARRLPPTISSSGVSRILPIESWKKHGRTAPSASTTTDTHGALQRTGGNGSSPVSAA